MGKFSFELHKNENNSDILLYLINLLKLHGNILKHSRFKLFKKITISFKHFLQTTSESPASHSGDHRV